MSTPPTAPTAAPSQKRRVGIVGFGHLGQYLAAAIMSAPEFVGSGFEVAFVWNRSRGPVDEAIAAGALPAGVRGFPVRPSLCLCGGRGVAGREHATVVLHGAACNARRVRVQARCSWISRTRLGAARA